MKLKIKTGIIVFSLAMILVSACGSKKEQEPIVEEKPVGNIIPRDKMVDVLVDFHLVDSGIKYNLRWGINTDIYSRFCQQVCHLGLH